MKRFRERYGRLLEWVVIALMVILAVEVTLGVVFRFAGRSLIWYDEVASVLLAWVRRAHIGCPELVERMPWPTRRAVSIAAQILVIAFFALLGGVGVWITPILATDTLVSLPWIPMSVVQSVIPIAAALIIVAEFTHLVDLIAAKRPP